MMEDLFPIPIPFLFWELSLGGLVVLIIVGFFAIYGLCQMIVRKIFPSFAVGCIVIVIGMILSPVLTLIFKQVEFFASLSPMFQGLFSSGAGVIGAILGKWALTETFFKRRQT